MCEKYAEYLHGCLKLSLFEDTQHLFHESQRLRLQSLGPGHLQMVRCKDVHPFTQALKLKERCHVRLVNFNGQIVIEPSEKETPFPLGDVLKNDQVVPGDSEGLL